MKSLENSVSWAFTPDFAEESIERKRVHLRKRYDRVTGTNSVFNGIGSVHGSISQYYWVLGDRSEAVEHRRIEAWYSHWWFRLHLMEAGESVELPLIGTDQTVVMQAQTNAISAMEPELVRALALNDEEFAQLLLGWEQPPQRVDALGWKVARHQLWWSFFGDQQDAGDQLSMAYHALDVAPDGDPLPFGGLWKQQYLTEYNLIRSVIEKSQEQFDTAIVAAHDYHVAFCSSPTVDGGIHNGNPSFAVNRPFSVIINHGVEIGLKLNYSSPYFVDLTPILEGLPPVAPGYEPA